MKRTDRGAVAVEFALVMPVLLLVLLGIVDFGRAMFVQNSLAHAASVGAQSLAIRATSGSPSDTQTAINLATATAAGTGIQGMASASGPVTVTVIRSCPPDTSTAVETSTAQVNVRIDFKWITPIAWIPGEKNSISATETWLCVFTQ